MITARSRPAVLLGVTLAAPLMVIRSAGADDTEPDFIAVNERGSGPVEDAGGALAWTLDLISLTTGEKIGTLNDRATCSRSEPPPCLVLDITSTYRVPDDTRSVNVITLERILGLWPSYPFVEGLY